jgi:hypothetical protein
VDVKLKPPEIQVVPSPAVYVGEPQRRRPDMSKMAELGTTADISLGLAIETFLRWAQEAW